MSLTHYDRVANAIAWLTEHAAEQPSLDDVAAHVGLSPHHFQRVFRRWAGVSPKRYLQYLTVEHAKTLLSGAESVLSTTYEVGLSGPGRLHDLFVSAEAVTPGEFKERGTGLVIRAGVHPTPFGPCVLGETARGVCHMAFGVTGRRAAERDILRHWPRAELAWDQDATGDTVRRVFGGNPRKGDRPVSLFLTGTNFQLKVWSALLRIPEGRVASYGQIARALGQARASRAVGAAVGRNSVACLVPCHRVIRASGALGGYRWGAHRKRALLAWEAGRTAGA